MDGAREVDTGAHCLAMIARFHEIAADPAQLAHEHAPGEAAMDVRGLVRAARTTGLEGARRHPEAAPALACQRP